MNLDQIRQILYHCISDKTILIVQEKKAPGKNTGLKYFALFSSLAEVLDEKTGAQATPEILKIQIDTESFRQLIITSIESVQAVSPQEVESFLKKCHHIIGSKANNGSILSAKQELIMLVRFWNDLWSIDIPKNTFANKT